MIAIRRRNVTDLELELSKRGFSVEIKRQIEHENDELKRLQKELNELHN